MGRTQASQKRNMTLLLVLAVLALVAIGLTDPFGWFKPSEKEQQAKDPGQKVLLDAKADDISSMEIKPLGEEAFTILRDKEEWWVVRGDKRYRANMERVQPMLDQLPGVRSESVVTSSAAKYEDLEVTPDKGLSFKVFAGGPTPKLDLLVGKAAEGYKACFVRVQGDKEASKEVYRSGVNIRALIAFSFNDYRTRKPWPYDPSLATEITVRRPPVQQSTPSTTPNAPPDKTKDADGFIVETQPADTLTFTKKDANWQLPDGKNGNQNSIKDLLQKFSELQISEYVDNPQPADTKFPDGATPSITVKTPTGTFSIILGPEKAGNRAVKDSAGVVYRMSSYPFKFYLEDLKFDELTFDDTAGKAAAGKDAAGKAPAVPGAPGAPAKPGTPPATPPGAKPGTPSIPPGGNMPGAPGNPKSPGKPGNPPPGGMPGGPGAPPKDGGGSSGGAKGSGDGGSGGSSTGGKGGDSKGGGHTDDPPPPILSIQ